MRRGNGFAYPPPRSETERGRGYRRPLAAVLRDKERRREASAMATAQWRGHAALRLAARPTPPSTALRAVPLPRFAGQDGEIPARYFAIRAFTRGKENTDASDE